MICQFTWYYLVVQTEVESWLNGLTYKAAEKFEDLDSQQTHEPHDRILRLTFEFLKTPFQHAFVLHDNPHSCRTSLGDFLLTFIPKWIRFAEEFFIPTELGLNESRLARLNDSRICIHLKTFECFLQLLSTVGIRVPVDSSNWNCQARLSSDAAFFTLIRSCQNCPTINANKLFRRKTWTACVSPQSMDWRTTKQWAF